MTCPPQFFFPQELTSPATDVRCYPETTGEGGPSFLNAAVPPFFFPERPCPGVAKRRFADKPVPKNEA
jgi:hypothetical protein